MCGIVGYVSIADETLQSVKQDFLRDALILDTFRGMDSTGIVTVREDQRVSTRKSLKMGWEYVTTKGFKNLEHGWAAIGHNRAATKGKVVRENAHPFTVGDVTLVHNGTLNNMGRNLPDFCSKQDVDSMNVTRAIAAVPPEDVCREVLEHLDGAFALVWFDKRDESLNIARNTQRPLHFAHNTQKSVLWYMSEGKHLDMLKKHKWCFHPDIGTVYQFSPYKLFKWKKGSILPVQEEFAPFAYRSSVGTGNHSGRGRGASSTGSDSTTPRSTQQNRQRSSKHVTPSNNVTGVPYSRRISVGGKVCPIPEALIEDLQMTTDLTPEDYLNFMPEGWQRYPEHPGQEHTGHGVAYGTVWLEDWETDWPCMVHNVHERNADKVTMDGWTVIPYATSAMSMHGENSGFCIMARCKVFEPWEDDEEVVEPQEESDLSQTFLGPFGRLVSMEEWRILSHNGCAQCSRDLWPEEHGEIWWIGEMEREPLCPACAEDLTHPRATASEYPMMELKTPVLEDI
jgi:hypothetical protein